MRNLIIIFCAASALAQRPAQVCGASGDPAQCTTIDTSRIGNLRFEDYRVTNPNAPLLNLDVRRAHLGQFSLTAQAQLCTATPNSNAIIAAPNLRFSTASAAVSETEFVSNAVLIQEVFALVTVNNLILSDGFSTPQFVFRLSRYRGTTQIILKIDPSYLPSTYPIFEFNESYSLSVDPANGRVTFLSALPVNAQLLRLYWSLARNLDDIVNANAPVVNVDPPPFNRPLFTADELRGLAVAFAEGIAAYASPTYSPIIDASCTTTVNNACPSQDALQTFSDQLALLGSDYLATRAPNPGSIIATNLAAWARANALRSATPQNISTLLKPIGLFWPLMQQDSTIPAADRQAINNWLQPLIVTATTPNMLSDYRGTTATAVRIVDAITKSNHVAFAESVERYFIAINQLRADGSIPEEAQRGACALTASSFAIGNLVSIAESAAAQGYDLYSLSANDRTLHTAIQFLLDAADTPSLIARYANSAAECNLPFGTGLDFSAFNLKSGTASPASWVEIYLARFPASANATRLRTRFKLTNLSLRPLYSSASGANTSCLFLTPQELTPVSLPNFDIVGGNDQFGPTNSTLPTQLSARLRSNSGTPLANILVNFNVTSGAATVERSSVLTDTLGIASTRLTLGPRSGIINVSAATLGLAPLTFSARAGGDDPKVSPNGIVGVGSSIPSVRNASPGAILSIYGADFVLPSVGRRVRAEEFVNNQLPTQFLGICVYFDLTRAYILDAYPNQLNIVVPNLTTSTALVRVRKGCGQPNEQITDPYSINITTAAPEFFSFQPNSLGNNPVAAVNSVTNVYLGPSNLFPGGIIRPARPGELVTVYLTGMGPTQPLVTPGSFPASLAPTRTLPVLKLGPQTIAPADITYSGFSPGSLIYQINFKIPLDAQPGSQPISVTIEGQTTPVGAYLSVGSL